MGPLQGWGPRLQPTQPMGNSALPLDQRAAPSNEYWVNHWNHSMVCQEVQEISPQTTNNISKMYSSSLSIDTCLYSLNQCITVCIMFMAHLSNHIQSWDSPEYNRTTKGSIISFTICCHSPLSLLQIRMLHIKKTHQNDFLHRGGWDISYDMPGDIASCPQNEYHGWEAPIKGLKVHLNGKEFIL